MKLGGLPFKDIACSYRVSQLPVLVVSRLHPVEWLPHGGVGHVLVVHLLDLEAVGEVLELDVGVFLDRQLRVGNGLLDKGA